MTMTAELGDRAVGLPLDVRDPNGFEAFEAEKRVGPLDVLVDNAGVAPIGLFVDDDPVKVHEHDGRGLGPRPSDRDVDVVHRALVIVVAAAVVVGRLLAPAIAASTPVPPGSGPSNRPMAANFEGMYLIAGAAGAVGDVSRTDRRRTSA